MDKEKLEKLKKQTIIASTGASMRLAGSKVSNKEVKELLELKETNKIARGRGTRYKKI